MQASPLMIMFCSNLDGRGDGIEAVVGGSIFAESLVVVVVVMVVVVGGGLLLLLLLPTSSH